MENIRSAVNEIVLHFMDDMHFHPRDDDEITEMVMQDLLDSGFTRGIPVFNYRNPVDDAWKLERELKRFHRIAPKFEIIPSIMLTVRTSPTIIRDVYSIGGRVIKLIPADLSTNSSNGVSWQNLPEKYPCFKEAERLGMASMNHVEFSFADKFGRPITHPVSRETMALPMFDNFARLFPGMPISIEHVSTRAGVDYILYSAPPNVKGGITVKHLLRTIFDVYDEHGHVRSDEWCMPIFKYPNDLDALIRAVVSGSKKFFYSSDKAAHRNKNPSEPAAGIYDGKTDICLLAKIFEDYDALDKDKLDYFVSGSGADHYGLPRNEGMITLRKQDHTPPEEVLGVRIFEGGKRQSWKVII